MGLIIDAEANACGQETFHGGIPEGFDSLELERGMLGS